MHKIIIAGRTRSGKDEMARQIADSCGLKILKTCTNRPRRFPDEDGYHFYTREQAEAIPREEKLFLTEALDGYERWTNRADLLEADIAILDFMGVAQAVRLYQSYGHSVSVIYVQASLDDRRAGAIQAAVAHGTNIEKAARDFEDRDRTESHMFDIEEQRFDAELAREEAEAILYPNFIYEAKRFFGEDWFYRYINDFKPATMDDFIRHFAIDHTGRTATRTGGYREFREAEPLILEPEDWTSEEWCVLCKLTGLVPDITARIELNVPVVKCYIDTVNKNAYKESEDQK